MANISCSHRYSTCYSLCHGNTFSAWVLFPTRSSQLPIHLLPSLPPSVCAEISVYWYCTIIMNAALSHRPNMAWHGFALTLWVTLYVTCNRVFWPGMLNTLKLLQTKHGQQLGVVSLLARTFAATGLHYHIAHKLTQNFLVASGDFWSFPRLLFVQPYLILKCPSKPTNHVLQV